MFRNLSKRVLFFVFGKLALRVFGLFLSLVFALAFFLSSLVIFLSIRDKDIALSSRQGSYVKRGIVVLANKYYKNFTDYTFDFQDLKIVPGDFNIFKKKYKIGLDIKQLAFNYKNIQTKFESISLSADLKRIIIGNIDISNLTINTGDIEILDKKSKKKDVKIKVKDFFIYLHHILEDWHLNEKNTQLINITLKLNNETLIFDDLTLKKQVDSSKFSIISNILYDNKHSKIKILCDTGEKKCDFFARDISTEIADFIVEDDYNSESMNINGSFLLDVNGLVSFDSKILLTKTKISLNLKDNFQFIEDIDFVSENLKLKIGNINLANKEDIIKYLKLEFDANNHNKDFNFLIKKLFKYIKYFYSLDLDKLKIKGRGIYQNQKFNNGFNLNFKDINFKDIKNIRGNITGKDNYSKIIIQSCFIQNIHIKNVQFILNSEDISDIEINFNINVASVLKDKFHIEDKDIDIPLKFQKNTGNSASSVKNTNNLKNIFKKIINFDIHQVKLMFEKENSNIEIVAEYDMKLTLSFRYIEDAIYFNGNFLKKIDKFDVSGSFNLDDRLFSIQLNNHDNSEFFFLKNDKNTTFIKVNSAGADGMFFINLVSKLKLNSNNNNQNTKIILDIDIKKIQLLNGRRADNLICNGYIQNLNFSDNFVLSFDLFDGKRFFKTQFNKNKELLTVENLEPLLYSLGTKIKSCSFKIYKDKNGEYILYVNEFEDRHFSVNQSSSVIKLIDDRYIKVKGLLVKFGFLYFTFDIMYDTKTGTINKTMESLSLIK